MEGSWIAQVGTENQYQYNSKELNEDFGLNLCDYGARWYDAALGRWWSVDPLGEKYQGWSGYNYGVDNPVRFVDPDGRSVTTEIYNTNGQKVGEDKNGKDGNVSIVKVKTGRELKKGVITPEAAISQGISTTYTELSEAEEVIKRTEKNGGELEESSVVQSDGKVIQGTKSTATDKSGIATSELPASIGLDNTSIHSHPLNASFNGTEILFHSALEKGPNDPGIFTSYRLNIIVGRLGDATGEMDPSGKVTISQPELEAAFFDRNSKHLDKISRKSLLKILKNK